MIVRILDQYNLHRNRGILELKGSLELLVDFLLVEWAMLFVYERKLYIYELI